MAAAVMKVYHDIDEVADVDGCRGRFDIAAEIEQIERDDPMREVEPAGELSDGWGDDILDQRGGDAFEGGADDDADGEIDDIAAHDELFEFLGDTVCAVSESLEHVGSPWLVAGFIVAVGDFFTTEEAREHRGRRGYSDLRPEAEIFFVQYGRVLLDKRCGGGKWAQKVMR